MHPARLALLLLGLSAVTACGSNPETSATGGGATTASSTGGSGGAGGVAATGGDGGTGGSGGFAPAAHAPFPILPDQGGPKLDHVHMVSVNFSGTQYADELATFGDWIVTSDYYTAAGAEYGVFAGTHEQRLLDEAPPAMMSTSDATFFLGSRIASGALPAPDAETLYVFLRPAQRRCSATSSAAAT